MFRLRHIVILIIMAVMWGLQFSLLKYAVQGGIDELNALQAALVLIALIYTVLVLIRRQVFWPDLAQLKFFIIIALLGYILPVGATLFAAHYLPAGVLTLLASLAPFFTFAVALTFKTEFVSNRRIIAMILGLAAVMLVLFPQLEQPAFGNSAWMLLALLIPFCYGVEPVYVSARWPEGLSVMQVGYAEAVVAAILTVPLWLWFAQPGQITLNWSLAEAAVVGFALIGVIEVFMYFYLVRITGGVLVSFATFISLFAGIGWGMLIFSESHSAWVWLAVAVLVLALGLVTSDKIAKDQTSTT